MSLSLAPKVATLTEQIDNYDEQLAQAGARIAAAVDSRIELFEESVSSEPPPRPPAPPIQTIDHRPYSRQCGLAVWPTLCYA